jgi:cytochrome b
MLIEAQATVERAGRSGPRRIVVWDIGVRAFHWLLLASVAGALATGFLDGKRLLDLHVILGTGIAALILLRMIWGFTGSTYARFASFVCGPGEMFAHARDLVCRRAAHHVGHNPVGTMMILTLLTVLAMLIATGVVALGGVVKEGPLAAFTTYASGRTAKEIHEALAFGLLGLIALHVTGIVVESLRTRESLVHAMLTGAKRERANAIVAAPARARPVLAAGLGAGVLLLMAGGVASLAQLPASGVPSAQLDAIYANECNACHSVHHPSIAPAATWTAIMAGLSDHFGENASLDAGTTAALTTYLISNSAERWDTRAANRLRSASTAEPLRITTTAGWRRLHRSVPDQAFALKPVGGKANCTNCHGDAETGRFAPRAIAIPEERATP